MDQIFAANLFIFGNVWKAHLIDEVLTSFKLKEVSPDSKFDKQRHNIRAHLERLAKKKNHGICRKECFVKFILSDMVETEDAIRGIESKIMERNIRHIPDFKIGRFVDLRHSLKKSSFSKLFLRKFWKFSKFDDIF